MAESESALPFDHGRRRGDRDNPHRGDCTETLCPTCGCCQHCTHKAFCGCTSEACGCEFYYTRAAR